MSESGTNATRQLLAMSMLCSGTCPDKSPAQFQVTVLPTGARIGRSLSIAVLCLLLGCQGLVCQTVVPDDGGQISGVVKSGSVPLPGVTVFAVAKMNGKKFVTSTELDGGYELKSLPDGRYAVHADMAAFAPATQEVIINAAHRTVQANFALVLLSQARPAAQHLAATQDRREFPILPTNQENTEAVNGVVDQLDLMTGISPDSPTDAIVVSRSQSPTVGNRQRKFDVNRPHGSAFYSLRNSALDAAPYSLTGAIKQKPQYKQNRFGASLGGPLNIPGIYKSGDKTSFFVSYNGVREEIPFDAFSNVPTVLERSGNFSQTRILSGPTARSLVTIFDPQTHQQFYNNTIPQNLIDPAAARLLKFIPEPNLPGDVENFHFITSANDDVNSFDFRLVHAFGGDHSGTRRSKRQNNINVGFHYRAANQVLTNRFPSIGGDTLTHGLDVPVSYVRSFGRLTNRLHFHFNRQSTSIRNLYAFAENIGGDLGITGVSSDPFDWGIPSLSFTNFAALKDTSLLLRRHQTLAAGDSIIWSHGKHAWRWGGDFRRIQINSRTDSNARGSFTFTGLNTAQIINTASGPFAVPGTGFDFADFLLGLPQLTSVQFGANNHHFRGNSWDLFVRDEWRALANLTLNLGLRYEYISPFSEINGLIANLDVSPEFTAAVPVCPAHAVSPAVVGSAKCIQVGPYTGRFPATLIDPDRNNLAPRVGIAWKPFAKIVVRAGYGINYNTSAYAAMVQQLAFQPPFSFTQTNTECSLAPATNCAPPLLLKLENGFPNLQAPAVTNNYGVDRHYRLGYVQIWNLDLQREIHPNVVLNLDYTGTKGTRLDILEAPNRGPDGIRIQEVQPFLWETSDGNSVAQAATVRLRKRQRRSVGVGGSYTFSKSIDDASTIGGGSTVVAQNAFDLRAERGLSSFDQRHRFTADYVVELPFGHDRHWLSKRSAARDLFGDWQWSGDWTVASGFHFTPRVIGNFAEVSSGTNGTLRPDLTGAPITISNPSVTDWFNKAAFCLQKSTILPCPQGLVVPHGQFGDAGRNIISGPGMVIANMALTKVIPVAAERGKLLEIRVQASNLLNTPQFTAIDTVVNSPSYGRVTSVGSMRRLRIVVRFRF